MTNNRIDEKYNSMLNEALKYLDKKEIEILKKDLATLTINEKLAKNLLSKLTKHASKTGKLNSIYEKVISKLYNGAILNYNYGYEWVVTRYNMKDYTRQLSTDLLYTMEEFPIHVCA